MNGCNILLVDDDPYVLQAVGGELEREGYHVTTAAAGEQALEFMKINLFHIVITDLVMYNVDGLEVLRYVRDTRLDTRVIILTGYGSLPTAIEALRSDADDYLVKPVEFEELHLRVRRCIEKSELQNKLKVYEKLLPVCCVCKKVRIKAPEKKEGVRWVSVEHFIHDTTTHNITSTYCPACAAAAERLLDD